MDSDDLYLSHRDTLESAIASICRRFRLPPDDAADFAGEFRLRLVREDYATLKQFQGRSSLRTYLHVVVTRAFQDWRNARWGKWRPSAEARRLGPTALRLETLIVRDRYTLDEAAEILRTNFGVSHSRGELEILAARFPSRHHRTFVSDEELETRPSSDPPPDRAVERVTVASAAERAAAALNRALGRLEPQDRIILRMRYDDALSVADIARALHLDQKPLYRRIERLLLDLRRSLEAEGLTGDVVAELLSEGGLDAPATPDDAASADLPGSLPVPNRGLEPPDRTARTS